MQTTQLSTYYCYLLFSYYFFPTCPRCSSRHPTPLFLHFPAKSPYFTQNPHQLRKILQNTPFYPPKSSKILLFIPQTPENPFFPLKNPANPYFFRFFIFFHQKSRIFSSFNTGCFNSLLFPIFPDFPEIIKFPALLHFFPISWPKSHENPIFQKKPPFFH